MTPDFFYGEMLRWSFGFENPNKAAVIFACLVPLLWAAWLVAFRLRSSSWQIISLIGAAIGFLALWCCLLLTFSRGGLVAAVSGMSVVSSWVWFGMSNRAPGGWSVILCRRRFWLSVLLIGVVAAAALALGMGTRSAEVIGDDASVGNRIALWSAALQMAYENPGGFGAGRSGAEFMQWYQEVDRTEGYRTMVNSYLTFLVEYGWGSFALLVIMVAALFASTWPQGNAPQALWVVALWASLVAFMVSGIFSTTMEEPVVWILPALATAGLIRMTIAEGWPPLISKIQLARALAGVCVLLSALFTAGMLKSSSDPIQRTFAPTSVENPTIVGVSPKITVNPQQLLLYPDESVLGPDWGKLLRVLAIETGRTVLISHPDAKGVFFDKIIVGNALLHNTEWPNSCRTFLLAPPISDRPLPENAVLLIPEIDEDGRSRYWLENVESALPASVKIISLAGVGIRVEWAWEQVVNAIKAP
jgi:hypothetical protein